MTVKTLKAKFEISGLLRFLSHRQTLKMFHRVFARSGIEVCFSQGFNPRPKMSLPVPKSVSLEVRRDVLVAVVEAEGLEEGQYFSRLLEEMPRGCNLKKIEFFQGKKSFVPAYAVYRFPIKEDDGISAFKLAEKLKDSLSKKDVVIERITKKGRRKQMDASFFIIDVGSDGDEVILKCKVTQEGALRVAEMAELLKVNREMTAGPVVRSEIGWKDEREIDKCQKRC